MRIAFFVGAMIVLSVAGFAQTVGQITGQVTDPSGAIVVGAKVTVTNSQTNVVAHDHDEQRRELLFSRAAARRLQRESGDAGLQGRGARRRGTCR